MVIGGNYDDNCDWWGLIMVTGGKHNDYWKLLMIIVMIGNCLWWFVAINYDDLSRWVIMLGGDAKWCRLITVLLQSICIRTTLIIKIKLWFRRYKWDNLLKCFNLTSYGRNSSRLFSLKNAANDFPSRIVFFLIPSDEKCKMQIVCVGSGNFSSQTILSRRISRSSVATMG